MASSFQPIVPATPAFRTDGTLYSPQFDDIYASSEGTLAETRHVFLQGNGLPERWRVRDSFTIVETGFGAGLNFLIAWQTWRETARTDARLHYVSVEKHPFRCADLERIHSRYPELADSARELWAGYPLLLPGFHRLHLDRGRVTLTLLFGDAAEMLGQLDARADAFFLDGFAPAKNPAMWSDALFGELARLARPGATLATYTVAGPVRQGLAVAGFAVEKREGFARKREMLSARLAGSMAGDELPADRRALVIGAGLAGTACAQRLAERGWDVEVIERHKGPAREASGNPAGLVRPVFSLDWNLHSRFTSAAFLYALRHQATLGGLGFPPLRGEGGVLHLARNADHFDKQQSIVERFALPDSLVRVVGLAEASALAGAPVAGPGWWFPEAAWMDPASMCRANLDAAGERVRCRFGSEAATLHRRADAWEVMDASGQTISSAPVAIIANAHFATRLSQAAWLPLRPVRGQVSLVPARGGRGLRIAVCREGYITPALDGMHCLGASFNEGMLEESERVEDHASNLRRLEAMLPGFGEGIAPSDLRGRVAFRAMGTDRLPVLGALPCADGTDQPALYSCLALGSRGMTWAALAAEIVASRICGEPMPVERSLLAALDPGRFAARRTQDRKSTLDAKTQRRKEKQDKMAYHEDTKGTKNREEN